LNALALQKSDRVPVVPLIITFAVMYADFRLFDYARASRPRRTIGDTPRSVIFALAMTT